MQSWLPKKKEENKINVFGFNLKNDISKMKGSKLS